MSNCAWCNKYGAVKFHSFDNGKKQYSQQKFCSKKCLAEYEQNNNTVKWYDAKYEDESAAKEWKIKKEEEDNYRKKGIIKGKKTLFSTVAIFFIFLGLSGLDYNEERGTHEKDYISYIILGIGIIFLFKRIKMFFLKESN